MHCKKHTLFLSVMSLLLLVYCIWKPIFYLDDIWVFGKSHAALYGKFYNDVDIIVPPLSFWIIKGWLLICDNYLWYRVLGAICWILILLTISKICALLGKDDFYTLLIIICYNFISNFYFDYNKLCLLLVCIMILIEMQSYKKKSILIGLLCGLCILSKHSIGGVVWIASMFLAPSWKERGIRTGTMTISLLLGTGGLFVNHQITEAYHQIFCGMSDFVNNLQITPCIICLIFVVVCSILKGKQYQYNHKWKCIFVYGVAFLSICFPIFDYAHVFLGISILTILAFDNKKEYLILTTIGITLFLAFHDIFIQHNVTALEKAPYTHTRILEILKTNTDEVNDSIAKLDAPIGSYCEDGMLFDIPFVKYANLPFTGNSGIYKQIDVAKKLLATKEYILLKKENICSQIEPDVVEYIKENCVLVEDFSTHNLWKVKVGNEL